MKSAHSCCTSSTCLTNRVATKLVRPFDVTCAAMSAMRELWDAHNPATSYHGRESCNVLQAWEPLNRQGHEGRGEDGKARYITAQ